MLSFHNKQEVKDKYVSRVEEHLRLGNIIQRTGYKNGLCAIACTLDAFNYDTYETELSLPRWLAHLESAIFSGIYDESVATKFPLDILKSISVGVDIENVQHQLAILRHKKQLLFLVDYNEPYEIQCKDAIQSTIDYLLLKLKGEETEDMRLVAGKASTLAARSASHAARSAQASYKSIKAAEEASKVKGVSDYFKWESETLIRLLKEVK